MGNSSGKVISALLLGAAVGSILGILFAPDKGSETRRKISKKGNDLTDAMNEKVQELIEEFKNETEAVKGKAKEFVSNEKSVIEQLKSN